MRILIDTNVLLDVLFARDPFLSDSITVLHMCEEGFAEAVVTSKSMEDIYYFLRKNLKSEASARQYIKKLMSMVTVCDVTANHLNAALEIDNGDYEDAVLAACAKSENCALIISRNKKHFTKTGVKCLTPKEFVI